MLKVVADNKIPYLRGVLEKYAEVIYLPGVDISADSLKDADVLITRTRTKCNAETLAKSKLKMIASASIGFDHIDTDWCEANGIEWTNAPGCNSESVKQYAASVLALLVHEKKWSLKGKSIAIAGVGNVGSKVSALAETLGMTVYEIDPPRAELEKDKKFHTLDDVIEKVDIVTFHTPLTKNGKNKTYHLCDETLLMRMKKNALIINSSRGEVVDGNALKRALQTKRIGEAVLDVWENEPFIDEDLLPLVWIATPHIAGYSQDGKAKATQMSIRAISKHINPQLHNWEAQGLPTPKEAHFVINCHNRNDEELMAEAVLHTYPLKNDDADLRSDRNRFEYLRGAYPLRREFQAYTINLKGGTKALQRMLLSMGFGRVHIT